jgi:hypothetical protein
VLRSFSEQSSALGAMLLAATSIGLYPDVSSAVDAAVAFDAHNRRTPDDQVHQLYEKMLSLHDELYAVLASRNIYEKALEVREMLAAHRR